MICLWFWKQKNLYNIKKIAPFMFVFLFFSHYTGVSMQGMCTMMTIHMTPRDMWPLTPCDKLPWVCNVLYINKLTFFEEGEVCGYTPSPHLLVVFMCARTCVCAFNYAPVCAISIDAGVLELCFANKRVTSLPGGRETEYNHVTFTGDCNWL